MNKKSSDLLYRRSALEYRTINGITAVRLCFSVQQCIAIICYKKKKLCHLFIREKNDLKQISQMQSVFSVHKHHKLVFTHAYAFVSLGSSINWFDDRLCQFKDGLFVQNCKIQNYKRLVPLATTHTSTRWCDHVHAIINCLLHMRCGFGGRFHIVYKSFNQNVYFKQKIPTTTNTKRYHLRTQCLYCVNMIRPCECVQSFTVCFVSRTRK